MARAARRIEPDRREEALARMKALYTAGNVQAARDAALSILGDPDSSDRERHEAGALRERSDLDPRALAIGLSALALGIVVVLYLLLAR